MTDLERSVLPYLRPVHVSRSNTCTCPPDSWAPCGGQYEGRYDKDCEQHRGPTRSHYPATCVRGVSVG
jgi:hypothetical protein